MTSDTVERRSSTPSRADLQSRIDELEAVLARRTRSLRRYQRAFNATPDKIAILSQDHEVIQVNQAMARAMNMTPEQAKGTKCFDILHDCSQPVMACPHERMLSDGKEHTAEIFLEALDRWHLVSVSPLVGKDGRIVGSIHIARDITSLKKTEQALKESEQRYHQLSNATMEGVLLHDRGKVIAANQVLADMFGYRLKEVAGMDVFSLVAPEDRARAVGYVEAEAPGPYELACVRRDGSRFPILVQARHVTFNGRRVRQTAIRDLTTQKAAEKQQRARERLQGVLEMAGAVCHELNQPLMAIYGYTEMLGMTLKDQGDVQTQLERISAQLERVRTITRKLMRITRYETKPYGQRDAIVDIDRASDPVELDEGPVPAAVAEKDGTAF